MSHIKNVPTKLDWTVYAGDLNVGAIKLRAEGAPLDITGATFLAQVRTEDIADPALLTATVTVTDEIYGELDIAWDGEEIRTLLNGESEWVGVWDFQILMPLATLPTTLLRGVFTAIHEVSRV
jgi:hypothetical protein